MTSQHPKSEFDLDRFEELAHNFIAIHLPDLSMNKHEEVCEGIGALAGDCCISIPARNDSDVLTILADDAKSHLALLKRPQYYESCSDYAAGCYDTNRKRWIHLLNQIEQLRQQQEPK